MLTQEEMNVLIPQRLKEIEKDYNVEILLAAESGSRAWGFASPDSDFDVRMIYKRPQAEYLRLDEVRDVIELPIDDTWDVSGWDLDKTLKLLNKSNPTMYEWFGSPIRYYGDAGFIERITPLLTECCSEKKMLFHYLNTAKHNIQEFLSGETVRPKKYFYVLRPILACYWVMDRHCPPPVLFSELKETMLPDSLRPEVEYLLDLKMNSPEKMTIPHLRELDEFLSDSAEKISRYMQTLTEDRENHWEKLNRFFLEETGR